MAYNTSKDWQRESDKNILNTGLSYGLSGASLGASIGGGIGALVGGVLGFGIGGIISMFSGNKSEVNQYINNVSTQRKSVTIDRNKTILAAQQSISSTRVDFDSTYGKGMFDQYDAIFMEILGRPASDSLSNILSNMQMDNVSGVINSKISGSVGTDVLTSTLSLTDINNEYLEYLKEQLRTQDTTFGIEMQSLSEQERETYSQYTKDINSLQLQYAQQFESAFIQNRSSNISADMAMGEASVQQATSGIRQEGSGTNLTSLQQFQNDLSKVAQSSVLKYQLQMMGYEIQSETDSLIYQSYSTRQYIRSSTLQQLNNLISQYNKQHIANTGNYVEISDMENAIDEYNKGISEAEKGRNGWFNKTDWSNLEHHEKMESYF